MGMQVDLSGSGEDLSSRLIDWNSRNEGKRDEEGDGEEKDQGTAQGGGARRAHD